VYALYKFTFDIDIILTFDNSEYPVFLFRHWFFEMIPEVVVYITRRVHRKWQNTPNYQIGHLLKKLITQRLQ